MDLGEKKSTLTAPEIINWNEEWKNARLRSSLGNRRAVAADFWNLKAKRYAQVEDGGAERAAQVVACLDVDGETSVMDIGCGPGTLSVPLAQKARTVTAIDPAREMISLLLEKGQKAGLSNIVPVNKRWEDILVGSDLEPHDVVVASYSLLMEDIREALFKMNAAAKRGVCLFWFTGEDTWGYAALWLKLFGERFVSGPDYRYLLNVLYQMGIHPNVELTRRTHLQRFSSLEDAVINWQENLGTVKPEHAALISKHLGQTLFCEDGKYCSRLDLRTAMIWWRKEPL